MEKIMKVRDIALFIIFVVNIFWKDDIPFADEIAMGLGLLLYTWFNLIEWASKNDRWRVVVAKILDHPFYIFLKQGYIVIIAITFVFTGVFIAFLPHSMSSFDEFLILLLIVAVFIRLYVIYRTSYKKVIVKIEEDGTLIGRVVKN